jgi:hypothetical protein
MFAFRQAPRVRCWRNTDGPAPAENVVNRARRMAVSGHFVSKAIVPLSAEAVWKVLRLAASAYQGSR